MGQRLVINIYRRKLIHDKNEELVDVEDKLIANAYYHWGGYNESALIYLDKIKDFLKSDVAKRICNNMIEGGDDNYNFMIVKELAIRALEYTGAGLNDEAIQQFNLDKEANIYPYWIIQDAVDRNEGLLEFNEERMEENKRFSEFDLDIFIDAEEPLLNDITYGGDIQFEQSEDDCINKEHREIVESVSESVFGSAFGYNKEGNFVKFN